MEDLTGRRFGSWKVLEIGPIDKFRHRQWYCECLCGKKAMILSCNLKKGSSKSCGCRSEIKRNRINIFKGVKILKI
jgi:hypothetical protein